jgi:hypothetical protein
LQRLRASGFSAVAIPSYHGLGTAILAVLGCRKEFVVVLPCDALRLPVVVARAMHCRDLRPWLEAGGRVEAWGWCHSGTFGGGRTWQVTKRPIGLADMARLERGGL